MINESHIQVKNTISTTNGAWCRPWQYTKQQHFNQS